MWGKIIRRIFLAVVFLIVCLIGVLRCGTVDALAACTKSGVEHPSQKRMNVGTIGQIYLNGLFVPETEEGVVQYKVLKISSSRKGLETPRNNSAKYVSSGRIFIYGKKKGSYVLTITIKLKKTGKKEYIKIPVYVGEKVDSIKSIKIGGKKLLTLKSTITDVSTSYYSEKASGKIQVNMDPRCKVTRIAVSGPDSLYGNSDDNFRSPEYDQGGWEQTVKNGEEVTLNDRASGETVADKGEGDAIPDTYKDFPSYTSEEEFDFLLVQTVITVYYKEDHSDEEHWYSLDVYTKNRLE